MKVLTLLGTRPEIIRLSLIIKKLDQLATEHVVVHTGQNYNEKLSDVFFQQMNVRSPNYHFSHQPRTFGEQIGQMFIDIDSVLEREQPDRVLILGDTNSALSAILAERRGIPVYHMEAGNRCYDRAVPEEMNRKIIDSTCTFNLPYTAMSRDNLLREGMHPNRIWISGNPIFEVLRFYENQIDDSDVLKRLGLVENSYILVTMHRAENVDDKGHLEGIVGALNLVANELGLPIICSVHPRTRYRLKQFGIHIHNSLVQLHEPFGFFDFVHLEKHAQVVVTDSGTVQEESCILGVPAVTIRNSTERPETVLCGSNIVSGLSPRRIADCVRLAGQSSRQWESPDGYQDPTVTDKIVNYILGGTVNHV